ncbi:hypothetical protein MMC09_000779 [Bachmanniomyces sp. S44760]|nr:hypothetical protein [Bachmanniomyces sp. S44760]
MSSKTHPENISRNTYIHVADSTELLPMSAGGGNTPRMSTTNLDAMSLGKPQHKPYMDVIDLMAITASVACLVVSICVISPSISLSWRLGFAGQIIAIGLLLSVMNLCMKRIYPSLFMLMEARWGGSRLQNYEALMRNSVFFSRTGFVWRITLLLLIILPMGLSVAYKRFLGGYSSVPIDNKNPGHYGLVPPPMAAYNVMNNSVYLHINASVPFLANSSSGWMSAAVKLPPNLSYGLNTLVLDNTSTAILDLPMPEYISDIQAKLFNDESWQLSASVNATVARYNNSVESHRDDDSYWEDVYSSDTSSNGLTSFELYNGWDLGLLINQRSASENPCCYIGNYFNGSAFGQSRTGDSTDPDSLSFRSSALMFEVTREKCHGQWEITRSDVSLLSGSCTGIQTDQSMLAGANPFWLDALPVLVHSLVQYSTTPQNHSIWKFPTFATEVATMYWARMIWIRNSNSPEFRASQDLYYQAGDETISSTRSTLKADWLLYLVLAIQPILTLLMFIAMTSFYSTPIGKGFGLVSILAGVQRDSLDVLKGSELSGEVGKPIRMAIQVIDDDDDDDNHKNQQQEAQLGQSEHERRRIQYFIGDNQTTSLSLGSGRSKLAKRKIYG